MSDYSEEPTKDRPPSFITGVYNAINGARQSATQEFSRFWESLGQSKKTIVPERKILTPKSMSTRTVNVFGRIIPDHNRRSFVKDAEIQTDEAPLSMPEKRKYKSDLFEEERLPKIPKNEPSPLIKKEYSAKTFDDIKMDDMINDRLVKSESRLSNHTFNRNDVRTGSKSVRRLTLELEEALSPKFPSSPSRKQFTENLLLSPKKEDTDINQHSMLQSPSSFSAAILKELQVNPNPKDIDNRLKNLEKQMTIARTQMNELNSDDTPLSPKPSHTTSPMRVQSTKLKSPIRIESKEASPIRLPQSTSTSPSRLQSKQQIHSKISSHQLQSIEKSLSPPITPNKRNVPFSYINDDVSVIKARKEVKPLPVPNDRHKTKMRELIQLIPTVKLRKTDTIIGEDGVRRPNPFWNEIYKPKNRF